jgi:predicted RNA binding protein YcfA (HicA-like mRNA interferase family)
MPSKQVSVREISEVLHELGFVKRARRGSHLLLQHPDRGVMLSLPTAERYVRLVVLRGIERSLESAHLVGRKDFRKRLGIEGEGD